MWACVKGCVSENLTGISIWVIVAIVGALIALGLGMIATGGTGALVAPAFIVAVEAAVGTYITVGAAAGITAIISSLVACIIHCF
jgi:hypothetical protein